MHIFTFWDGDQLPIIELCFQTLSRHHPSVVRLDSSTVRDWIDVSSLPPIYHDPAASWALKTDILRIALLYQYGGLWIDADIVVLHPLDSVLGMLTQYDAVLFGATGTTCTDANVHEWLYPSNWMIACRKGGVLITRAYELLTRLNHATDPSQFAYHDLGKNLLWTALNKCPPDYSYFHVHPKHCGIRDHRGNWVTTARLLQSGPPLVFLDGTDAILVLVWYLSDLPPGSRKTSAQAWLSSGCHMSRFLRKALFLRQT